MDITYSKIKFEIVPGRPEVFRTISSCTRTIIDGNFKRFDRMPALFETDGASVPRPFWAFYPPWGIYRIPAIWHDFDYRYHGLYPRPFELALDSATYEISRYTADKYFNKGMKMIDDLSRFDRRVIYLAVRSCGGDAWDESFTRRLEIS